MSLGETARGLVYPLAFPIATHAHTKLGLEVHMDPQAGNAISPGAGRVQVAQQRRVGKGSRVYRRRRVGRQSHLGSRPSAGENENRYEDWRPSGGLSMGKHLHLQEGITTGASKDHSPFKNRLESAGAGLPGRPVSSCGPCNGAVQMKCAPGSYSLGSTMRTSQQPSRGHARKREPACGL
jgi:hypothetical protein